MAILKDKSTSGPGTVVGANVKLVGTLKDTNDIVVHGRVEGEVISDSTVTVAESSHIKGPVTAQVVKIFGNIKGAVAATEKLEISPTGKISGSITTKDLTVQSGAAINGKCSMPEGEIQDEPAEKKDVVSEKKDLTYEVE